MISLIIILQFFFLIRDNGHFTQTLYNDDTVVKTHSPNHTNVATYASSNVTKNCRNCTEDQHEAYVDRLDRWKYVDTETDTAKVLVFSAYHEIREQNIIRVIAVMPTKHPPTLHCLFWYGQKNEEPLVISAKNKPIPENWGMQYSAYYILCPLANDSIPKFVSITRNKVTRTPSNKLTVHSTKMQYQKDMNDFAVCVKPFHYKYNKSVELTEFIEFYKLMGASSFTFYNHTVGSAVDVLLQSYMKNNLVDLLQWQLPVVSQKQIRTEGMFAAFNDCLYRNMAKYKFVFMVDTDEYIVPQNPQDVNVLDILKRMSPKLEHASYCFCNTFFYRQFEDDPSVVGHAVLPKMITMAKTRRTIAVWKPKMRSKCVINTNLVITMGNHFTWEKVRGSKEVFAQQQDGLLHHYRVCEFGGEDCVKLPSQIDRTMYRWKDILLKSVLSRLENNGIPIM